MRLVLPMKRHYLAIDLGAESGRVMLGTLANGQLSLDEVHRFPNHVGREGNSLHWDISALFSEVKSGLRKAAALKLPITSVSTDSWGIDYVLFGADGQIMQPTFHYRDPRTARGVERVRSVVPRPEVFAETGIQFMPLNTIYQLAAEDPARLRDARQLLPIADAFNCLLCGVARAEESLASTTQLYNPCTRDWSPKLFSALKLPREIFPSIVPSGTKLGMLKAELACELGLPPVEVIATCSHDTGAAVAAVPGSGDDWAYLSSGTWSLLGAELRAPLLTERCREFNFTNEIGHGGTVRLLKNLVGLWIVQECRREWVRQGHKLDYATLMSLAEAAPAFISLINPDDPRFLAPGDMPEKVAAFCRESNQPAPATPGATVRCVLESLALAYRRTFEHLVELAGHPINRLHIVGGGSQSALLNQFTANALGIRVLAGPVEATALGNVLVQAIARGDLPSLAAARELVRDSFPITRFEPRDGSEWNEAWKKFQGTSNQPPNLRT
jgi:rhamnulokinase